MRTSIIPERRRCHGINPSDKSRKPVVGNRDVIKVKLMGDRVNRCLSELKVNQTSEHRISFSYSENGN
jgi:hypothetical protein